MTVSGGGGGGSSSSKQQHLMQQQGRIGPDGSHAYTAERLGVCGFDLKIDKRLGVLFLGFGLRGHAYATQAVRCSSIFSNLRDVRRVT